MLVPLKAIDPKSRLADVLVARGAGDLMRSLLERVVGVVQEAGIDRVTVVTGEPIEGYDTWLDQGLPGTTRSPERCRTCALSSQP